MTAYEYLQHYGRAPHGADLAVVNGEDPLNPGHPIPTHAKPLAALARVAIEAEFVPLHKRVCAWRGAALGAVECKPCQTAYSLDSVPVYLCGHAQQAGKKCTPCAVAVRDEHGARYTPCACCSWAVWADPNESNDLDDVAGL